MKNLWVKCYPAFRNSIIKLSVLLFQYTLAGFVRNVPFTLLRVLMQKKDTKSYKELFNFML